MKEKSSEMKFNYEALPASTLNTERTVLTTDEEIVSITNGEEEAE